MGRKTPQPSLYLGWQVETETALAEGPLERLIALLIDSIHRYLNGDPIKGSFN